VDHFFSYGLERLRSGASGAVIGRNVWGASGITRTLRAMRAAIHGE
jgi:DhnA family fructose-bisphosphate aldolase class Ia